MRHTKIVATIGPASSDEITIQALVRAGVDVFRLNFSHGDPATHVESVRRVREAAAALGRHVAVLQDLSGPKIRTGTLEGGEPLTLSPGDRLDIALGSFPGKKGVVSTTYEPLVRAVAPGAHLLLDDGRIELQVEEVKDDRISTRVLDGGKLGEHKGINAPNVPLPVVGLTEKDEADLRIGLEAGVDIVALSFVQSAGDIEHARALTAGAGRPRVPIVAKLERREAVNRLPEIAAVADAVMVARGDLGLEVPLEEVPRVQKEALRICRRLGIPGIVATQVLESMREEYRPTRAEVSDAASAVDMGTDAIMLSGETAVGRYPTRAVEVLAGIIRNAEASPPMWTLPGPSEQHHDHLQPLCDAAATLASRSGADAIVALTRQGRTARVLSARRPLMPIYAATDDQEVARRLCLWRGVYPTVDPLEGDADAVAERVVRTLRRDGFLPTPTTIVIVSANPDVEKAHVNFVALRSLR
jgi:pyruvate kinase